VPRETVPVTQDEEGNEHHPAFGLATIHRITSNPGGVMFQSDIRHREYIMLTVSEATRTRDVKHDWVHATRVVCQVSMSMAQFASMVASGGQGDGVPVTIERTELGDRPGMVLEPRLAKTTQEVRKAADEAFQDVMQAFSTYSEALDRKAGAVERRNLLRNLKAAISNAGPNVEYAGKKLAEHAEAVVENSRADIEAMAASSKRIQAELPPFVTFDTGNKEISE
jgi:hypothetical protein